MLKGKNGFYNRYVKRIIDIICALLAIMVFWWLYLIVAVLVRIKLGSPIIFKQERPGKIDKKTGKETIFNLYKFRTMTDKRDVEGNLLPDDVRLTKFGRILRSTSLDELPEAFNILKGDMSVIGPRPLLVEYLPYYTRAVWAFAIVYVLCASILMKGYLKLTKSQKKVMKFVPIIVVILAFAINKITKMRNAMAKTIIIRRIKLCIRIYSFRINILCEIEKF